MPRYEGIVSGLKVDGGAEVIIRPDSTGVPGVSPGVNRRVCHCASDGSTLVIEAFNRAGAGIGDRVLVSRDSSGLIKNAAALLGIPAGFLLTGLLFASLLGHVPAFHFIYGTAVAALFLIAGILLGVRVFKRVSAGNQPVIDSIVGTGPEESSLYEGNPFPKGIDCRSCDGCSGPFS